MSSNHRESSNCYYALSPFLLPGKTLRGYLSGECGHLPPFLFLEHLFAEQDRLQELVIKIDYRDSVSFKLFHEVRLQVITGDTPQVIMTIRV